MDGRVKAFVAPVSLPSMLGCHSGDDSDEEESRDLVSAAEEALNDLMESDHSDETPAPSPPPQPNSPPLAGSRARPAQASPPQEAPPDYAFESLIFELRSRQEECERLKEELALAQTQLELATPFPKRQASVAVQPGRPRLNLSRVDPAEVGASVLRELDLALALDADAVVSAGYPVRVSSLSNYLASVRLGDKHLAASAAREAPSEPSALLTHTCALSVARLAPCAVAARLVHICGARALPQELRAFAYGEGDYANSGRGTEIGIRLGEGLDTYRVHERCAPDGPASCRMDSSQGGWRSLLGGILMPVDPTVCGLLQEVPPLPNPFTVLDDIPALARQMLSGIAPEDWDARRFSPPLPVTTLPSLFRGTGGMLPGETPRQLALNAIAAAVLNRLSSNLMVVLSRACVRGDELPRESAEEFSVVAARKHVSAALAENDRAKAEEAAAIAGLQAFQARYETNMDRHLELESIVGWKSGVAKQALADLAEAQESFRIAEATLAEAAALIRSAPWHEVLAPPLPAAAALEPLFLVRMTARSSLIHTVSELIETLQRGSHDSSGCGTITMHRVEAAFVRHAMDNLALCTQDSDRPGAYTHLLAPGTFGTGLTASDGSELRAVQPHHRMLLRCEGPTFPFVVLFGAVEAGLTGFVGLGTHSTTFTPPWNPLEYEDVLWTRQVEDCMHVAPLLAALASGVADPTLPMGFFPPNNGGETLGADVPFGGATVALLQAVVYGEVRIWPVTLPAALRSRWDYVLRTLSLRLQQGRGEHEAFGLDAMRAALPRCLAAFAKVPDDVGGGCGAPALENRLRRLAASVLTHLPLRGAGKTFLARVAVLESALRELAAELEATGCSHLPDGGG